MISRLGRWASADPLQVHAVGGGEAINSYHYVAGNLLAGRDPLGLNPGASQLRARARGFMLFGRRSAFARLFLGHAQAQAGVPESGGWVGRTGNNISMYRRDSRGEMTLTPVRIARVLRHRGSASFVSRQLDHYQRLDPEMDESLVLSFAVHESGIGVLRNRPGETANTYGGSGADSIANAGAEGQAGRWLLPRDFSLRDVQRSSGNERWRLIRTGTIDANDELIAYAALLNRGRQNAEGALGASFSGLSLASQRVWTILGTRPGTLRNLRAQIQRTTTDGASPDYERIVTDASLAGRDSVRVARVKAANAEFLDRTIGPNDERSASGDP